MNIVFSKSCIVLWGWGVLAYCGKILNYAASKCGRLSNLNCFLPTYHCFPAKVSLFSYTTTINVICKLPSLLYNTRGSILHAILSWSCKEHLHMFLFSTNISSVAHCCTQFLHIEHNCSISSTLSTILVHQITTHVPYSIWILVFCKHHSVSAQKRIFWTFKPITKPYFLLYATHWLHFVTIYSCTGHHIRTKCSIFVSMPWCLLKHKMNTLQNSLPDKTRDRNNFFITLSIQVCHLSWLVWIYIVLMYSCFVTMCCKTFLFSTYFCHGFGHILCIQHHYNQS